MTNKMIDKEQMEKTKKIVSAFVELNNFKDHPPLKKILLKVVGHKVDTIDSLEKVVYRRMDMEGNARLGFGFLYANESEKFNDPNNFSNLENSVLGFYYGLKNYSIPNILFAANESLMSGYEQGKNYEKKENLLTF